MTTEVKTSPVYCEGNLHLIPYRRYHLWKTVKQALFSTTEHCDFCGETRILDSFTRLEIQKVKES